MVPVRIPMGTPYETGKAPETLPFVETEKVREL